MGITGLLPLLKSIQKPCSLKAFSGKTIGVDAYGWLHRGTVSCAIDLAQGRHTTKYVDFAMSRVRMLIHFGITPYLVFDGDYLPSKAGTEKRRASSREESRRAGLELLRMGKASQAHAELQKAVDVTPEMARMLIEALKSADVKYVVAPYEADAQLTYMERKGLIHGILSEDSDLLVFGAQCLITKLDQYGECIMIRRDDFTACREISLVGWTDAEFRRMAILSGCDYLPSINKMGLKTAYRLMRKHKTVERLLRVIQFDGQYKVPATYLEDFIQAERTFLYQWVFCPLTKKLVHHTDPTDGFDAAALPYIGKYIEPKTAQGVASGHLHPHTKEVIVLKEKPSRPMKPMAPPSRRQSVAATPELKKNMSIESFFAARRTPLAELDPNCFTPSPSQRRALDRNPASWSASPAPTRSRSASLISAVPSSAPPPRRTISDSWSRSGSASRPAKKQRLCSETTEDSGVDPDSQKSRFFASTGPEPSPSVRPKKSAKPDFNLWSDDSIEEAMAAIPDMSFSQSKANKVLVFTGSQTSQGSDSKDDYVQSSLASTQVFSQRSTSTRGTLTPATSFGSPDEDAETLIANVSTLSAKFAYCPTSKTPEAPSREKKTTPSLEVPRNEKTRSSEVFEDASQAQDAEEPQLPEIGDAAFKEAEAAVVVLASETGEVFDESTAQHETVRGSEDMLVPDSEGEEDEDAIEVTPRRPMLDLKRFAYCAS